MHWDTFEQDNYSTVGGDGDVGSSRYKLALYFPHARPYVLSYSNCKRSADPPTPFLSEFSEI